MLRFRSIMLRIIFLHAVALLVTAILLPFVLYWSLDADVERLQQGAMREQAERIARYLTATPTGAWSLDLPASLRDQFSEAYGRYSYAVLDDAKTVIFSSHAEHAPLYPINDDNASIAFFETPTPRGGRTISGASLKYDVDDKTAWVQVAEDLSHRDVLLDDVVANYFHQVRWITIPTLLLLLAIDFVIFRRAVRPLLHASEQARSISPTRIDVRLPTGDIPNEIQPLVVAVNQALDRLERGFRAQRDFAADAAHELRTPLAILRTRIETLPDKDVAQTLAQDVAGMTRVVNQLLDAAELETIIIDPAEKADLRDICIEIAGFIAPLALARGKRVAVTGTDAPVIIQGNAEMLRRAVRNLVENAFNHTSDDSIVEIMVTATGTVSVLDRGPGVAASEREIIFERFWRRDRRVGSAGLGLSIVKRIVQAHGGTITVDNRAGGGADFSMHFPVLHTDVRSDGIAPKPVAQASSASAEALDS
ncbi:histidine kinase [Afipia sp. P52-10]|jgi:signal transduction histidine kinase|uniref:sensor histidine kinase n=1 Tax=Afipia sp. P52-10 TaxID=1429916 RepID=UPI0003DEFA80|nr:ATP-binding protein [Afipia sp. P52-10]ETR78314.1 histidine kinase [Afipia sp. P52-10]